MKVTPIKNRDNLIKTDKNKLEMLKRKEMEKTNQKTEFRKIL